MVINHKKWKFCQKNVLFIAFNTTLESDTKLNDRNQEI